MVVIVCNITTKTRWLLGAPTLSIMTYNIITFSTIAFCIMTLKFPIMMNSEL